MTIDKIKQKHPLIHCITNYVVANFTANGLLAIGASPVMADEVSEVEEMTAIANGLLINIGTLNQMKVPAMLAAGKAANKHGVPVVLDPVGVGATSYRKQVIQDLLQQVKFTLIRCNEGELAAIAGVAWQAKGVDSGQGTIDTVAVAQEVAQKYDTIVVVTGETDIVTDGTIVEQIAGGHERMTAVTGSGCLLSALCTAALTVEGESTANLAALLQTYKQIALEAANNSTYIGSFQVEILNGLEKYARG
ncbi:hydroxyethylthiazole kinase [Metasolibacillus meyeri]|uniref:Hydroxyethylthiazole kinase n=1 Tax=Metasolibacillus meyeri TaxID=1071052 RepID=A0AAW9NNP9_9BACL|nr:hydroxyethylthiazole kinase [Metasolibacillus meyeri]MEC1177388.1 hydroxyethylthiazole kinase [Metasolibacillus meyeri]